MQILPPITRSLEDCNILEVSFITEEGISGTYRETEVGFNDVRVDCDVELNPYELFEIQRVLSYYHSEE